MDVKYAFYSTFSLTFELKRKYFQLLIFSCIKYYVFSSILLDFIILMKYVILLHKTENLLNLTTCRAVYIFHIASWTQNNEIVR